MHAVSRHNCVKGVVAEIRREALWPEACRVLAEIAGVDARCEHVRAIAAEFGDHQREKEVARIQLQRNAEALVGGVAKLPRFQHGRHVVHRDVPWRANIALALAHPTQQPLADHLDKAGVIIGECQDAGDNLIGEAAR